MNQILKSLCSCLLSLFIVSFFSFYPLQSQANPLLEDGVLFKYVDPLIKVFPSSSVFPDVEARADVARGTRATFQFAILSNKSLTNLRVTTDKLQSKNAELGDVKINYVGNIQIGHMAPDEAHDRLHPISKYYPDPLFDTPPKNLRWGLTQAAWIKIPISVRRSTAKSR